MFFPSTELEKYTLRKIFSKIISRNLYHEFKTRDENNEKIYNREYISYNGLTASDLLGKIEKIGSCCSILELRKKTESDEYKISNANYCQQHLVCPQCAKVVQHKRRGKFHEAIEKATKHFPFAYHVVFTIKDGPNLSDRIDFIKDSLKRFRTMGQKREGDKRSGGEFSKVKSGLMAYEIKKGDNSGMWHVHAHSLLFTSEKFDYSIYDADMKRDILSRAGGIVNKYELSGAVKQSINFEGENVPVSKLSAEWFKATEGDSINIKVIPIYGKEIVKKSNEVLKYITKIDEIEQNDMLDLMINTYNRRMFSTFGYFRKIDIKEYDAEVNKKEYPEIYSAGWNEEFSKYGDLTKQHKTLFEVKECKDDLKKEYLKKSAIIQGKYRTERRKIREKVSSIAADLDNLKDNFKGIVKRLWKEYNEVKFKFIYRKLPPPAEYLQLLFKPIQLELSF